MSINTGNVFTSFDALSLAIKELELQTFCKYTLVRSSSLRFKGHVTPERLKKFDERKKLILYESLTYTCKHGTARPVQQAAQIRPKQAYDFKYKSKLNRELFKCHIFQIFRTYKLGCRAGFEVRLHEKGLIIKECNISLPVHLLAHTPSARDFDQLPEVRRLDEADATRAKELRGYGATAMKIRDTLTKETGKAVLSQDLKNLQYVFWLKL